MYHLTGVRNYFNLDIGRWCKYDSVLNYVIVRNLIGHCVKQAHHSSTAPYMNTSSAKYNYTCTLYLRLFSHVEWQSGAIFTYYMYMYMYMYSVYVIVKMKPVPPFCNMSFLSCTEACGCCRSLKWVWPVGGV